MEPFASNLRRRNDELGISLAEAARRAGLSERRFGNYATGRREPDLATLVRIATSLGTTPDHLLLTGEDAAGESAADTERGRLRSRMLAASQCLDDTDLNRATIMVEALVARPGAA